MEVGVIEQLIDVKREHYDAILEELVKESIVVNDRVEASFHFIKYHDCVCREQDFLEILRQYIICYCFPRHRYKDKSNLEIVKLVFEARDKFFNPSDPSCSGELGEITLYFLLEAYLSAPQIVSKMSLKTTQGGNYKGSDGIHLGFYKGNCTLFYCESKLDKERSDAFKRCIDSVLDFHKRKKDFEISIVRNNIDVQDEELKKAIIYYLDPTIDKAESWIETNACFIGYDWNKFDEIESEPDDYSICEKLKKTLTNEIEKIRDYLNERIKYPTIKQRFYFFIIPFKDVEKLREKFMELLYGSK